MTKPLTAREALEEEIVSRIRYIGVKAGVAETVYGAMCHEVRCALAARLPADAPIDMLLFCPRCNKQHVDAPQPEQGWTNPPHATHTCQHCGLLWRPSNENTNGAQSIAVLEAKHTERIAASFPAEPAALPERRVIAAFISPQNQEWQGRIINVTDDGKWWHFTGTTWAEEAPPLLAAVPKGCVRCGGRP